VEATGNHWCYYLGSSDSFHKDLWSDCCSCFSKRFVCWVVFCFPKSPQRNFGEKCVSKYTWI